MFLVLNISLAYSLCIRSLSITEVLVNIIEGVNRVAYLDGFISAADCCRP